MTKSLFVDKMNELGKDKIPFIFIINYTGKQFIIEPLKLNDSNVIQYSLNGFSNAQPFFPKQKQISFNKYPMEREAYKKSFAYVMENLQKGNSYLTNLTCETPIETNLNLREIFHRSKAPYKLWYKDEFVVFSPEIFVQIEDGKILSFPMKGTIDGSIKDAELKIMENMKERAEHVTIVDLIRNDLSRVASNVKVDKYRYIDRLKTNGGELLQVSSQISGDLPLNFNEHLGDIFEELLPAGSICGAPKKRTLDIISKAETHDRGFYTGVFGIFDGKNLDSAVMIRFIENKEGKFIYKSGGGITANSEMETEYNEMIQKVYLPF